MSSYSVLRENSQGVSLGMSGQIAIVKTAAKKISLSVMMRISSSLPQRRLELKNVNDHRI